MQCNQTWNQTFPTTGLLFGLWWEQSVHCFLWNSGHRRWNLWVTWLKLRIQDPNPYFVLFKWVKRCIALLEKQLYTCAVSLLFGVMEFLLLLLGQWLNFKLFVIDIFSLNCYFRVHWPSESFFWSVSTTKSDDFDSSKDQLHLRGSLAEHGGHHQSSGHRQRGTVLGVVGYELRKNHQGGRGIWWRLNSWGVQMGAIFLKGIKTTIVDFDDFFPQLFFLLGDVQTPLLVKSRSYDTGVSPVVCTC